MLRLALLASLLLPCPGTSAPQSSRATGKAPLDAEILLRSGEKQNLTITQFFADGINTVPSPQDLDTDSASIPSDGGNSPTPRFIPWGAIDLDWLLAENPKAKPPRALSTYGGEKLDSRGVWLDVSRDEGVSPRDTALRITLRRTTGTEASAPVELECIFLKPDDSQFVVVTRRIELLALPLGQSNSVWCAPKSPLLHTRRTLQPPAKSYKRPIHWVVRVRSHRRIIATVTSDRAIATWIETAHLPDPRSPFGGTWRNYGQ